MCYSAHSITSHKDPAAVVNNSSETKSLQLEAPSLTSLPPSISVFGMTLIGTLFYMVLYMDFYSLTLRLPFNGISPAYVPNNKSTCSDEIKSCIDDAVS